MMKRTDTAFALYQHTFRNAVRSTVITTFAVAVTAAGATCLTVSSLLAQPTYRAVQKVRIRPIAANAATSAGNIEAVAQLANGTFVVGDNINTQLHLYTAAGRYTKSIGRKGAGKGEFNSVRWVGECAPNTIYAYDNVQNRITIFTATGELVRSFSPAIPRPAFLRCTTDGTILLAASSPVLPDLSQRGMLQLNDSTGKLLYRSPELLMSDGHPLGKQMTMSMSPDGIVYGNGERDSFTYATLRGEGARQVSAGAAGKAPTPQNIDQAIESWASLAPDPAGRDRTRAVLRKMKPVAALAPYNDLAMDDTTRSVWVRVSNPGDPGTVLERRGLDGALQGRVSLPPGLEIAQVRADVLVARLTDAATGEESVVSYHLTK